VRYLRKKGEVVEKQGRIKRGFKKEIKTKKCKKN